MKGNEFKDTVNQQPTSKIDNEFVFDTSDDSFLEICELLNQGDDEAASDAFDESFVVICELLNQVDFESTGDALNEDFSDISELRSQLRAKALQGLCWFTVGICLILSSFAIVTL